MLCSVLGYAATFEPCTVNTDSPLPRGVVINITVNRLSIRVNRDVGCRPGFQPLITRFGVLVLADSATSRSSLLLILHH